MKNWIGIGVLAWAVAISAWGKHPSNAGPENVELKFRLPAPRPLPVEDALKTFTLQDGLAIDCVSSEPLVEDPIAVSWDDQARMYVCEFRGYMHDVEGKGEDQPIGRIKLLEDVDGDGKYEKASIFVDGLVMPRAVMAVGGGALVGAPPFLYHYRDTDGDGKADQRTIVAEDFGRKGGQPEHMANSPTWMLDNWIYCSNHGKRYKYNNGKWLSEPTRTRGQWGITQDDWGRPYYNYNSDFLRADLLPGHYLARNPNFAPASSVNVKLLADQSVWPGHPTPGTNRAYQPNALREDGSLKSCTATCGPGVYRGDLFPKEYLGNVFLPEPSVNLMKRVTLAEADGMATAANAYHGKEFLTSTDERFRPVNAYTGPDGAIYVVDLYRGVLQHKGFLTHYLIANIKDRKLEMPVHYGRIYRIYPKGAAPRPTKLPTQTPALVEALKSGNGWVRDTAQRVLVERRDPKSVSLLKRMARIGPNPLARLHALWTLDGMGKLESETALAALGDVDPKVRAAGVRLCESFLLPATRDEALPSLLQLARHETAPDVQIQLALTMSAIPTDDVESWLALVLHRDAKNPLMREAILSGVRGRELEFLERIVNQAGAGVGADDTTEVLKVLGDLAQCVMAERRPTRVKRLLDFIGTTQGNRRLAMLQGAAGSEQRRGSAQKLIWLDARPAMLERPRGDAREAAAIERLSARLAWPGKEGVRPPAPVRQLAPAEKALFEEGKVIYANTCAACHQPNGMGQEGLAPPLAESEWVLGPAERPIRMIMHGLAGPVMVGGRQYNMEMPALPDLNDEQIAAVLTYIRREWEHGADPVDVATVGRVREMTGERGGMWTAEELMKVK